MTSNRDSHYPRICEILASQHRDTSCGTVFLEPPEVANLCDMKFEYRPAQMAKSVDICRELGLINLLIPALASLESG